MRNKMNLSKALLRSKSAQKCIKLREKLDSIEYLLQSSCEKRRSDQEKKAIAKMKKDPKAFFSYAKRFSKTNSDIGPFFNEDGPKTILAMLSKQYDSVFSIPVEEKTVKNPREFFLFNEAEETILESVPFDRQDIIDKIYSLSVVQMESLPFCLRSVNTVLQMDS